MGEHAEEGEVRRTLFGVVVGFALATVVGLSQGGGSGVDPFNGTWRANAEMSKELPNGETPFHEVITFKIGDDGVQHYQVEIQDTPDSTMVKGWYESKYNEAKFVTYNGNVFAPGKGIEVMTVKVDDRTHYRIARSPEGEARYVMMRRLSEDGQFYMSAGLMTDGSTGLYKWMERVAE